MHSPTASRLAPSSTPPHGARSQSCGDPSSREHLPLGRASSDKLQVLLVEDQPGDAELVRELGAADWEIIHVPRLADAIWQLDVHPPHVVLLDLGLPDSRGLHTLRSIHHIAPQIPVIVLTGRNDEDLAAQAVRDGAQEFLAKDAMTEALLTRTVRHSVERQRLLLEVHRQGELAREAERELHHVLHSHVDATLVVGPDDRVLLANAAAKQLLSGAEGKLEGTPSPIDIHEPPREHTCDDPEGRHHVLEVTVTPISWHGGTAHLICLHDVTERRQTEEMQRRLMHADRLRSIGELAAGVAHEVNNPASVALTNTETLSEHVERVEAFVTELRETASSRAIEPEQLQSLIEAANLPQLLEDMREIAQDDHTGLLRIRSMVRSLRAFARIERDEIEPIRVDEHLEEACQVTGNEVRHRAHLVRELQPVRPIEAHPSKLSQVFVNLLVNAAHAAEDHEDLEPRVVVRSYEGDHEVVVEIEDTGGGIPESLRERIFEPFYTTKSRERGTGLGLPISAEIVRQHGGRIEVSSSPGRGSVFRVTLPYDTGLHSAPSGAHPRQQPLSRSDLKPARVLLVDDEPMVLRATRRALRASHEIVVANGGREALDILARDSRFDVIVCDLMMPDVDGVSVYRQLSQDAPELAQRMVFVSGGAVTERTRDFVANIEHPVLDKPTPGTDLLSAIDRLTSDDGPRGG